MAAERILSIFIDESGDLGEFCPHAPYYFFTLVFHEQAIDISESVQNLERRLAQDGYPNHTVHTGPLIRREDEYRRLSIDERRCILNRLFYFTRKAPISYISFCCHKGDYVEKFKLLGRMARDLSVFIRNHLAFFHSFDETIIYYDNGQQELTTILVSVFSTLLSNIDYRTISPKEYRLAQTADLVCTMELLALKLDRNEMTKSEKHFFYKPKEPKKPYIQGIRKLHIDKK